MKPSTLNTRPAAVLDGTSAFSSAQVLALVLGTLKSTTLEASGGAPTPPAGATPLSASGGGAIPLSASTATSAAPSTTQDDPPPLLGNNPAHQRGP